MLLQFWLIHTTFDAALPLMHSNNSGSSGGDIKPLQFTD